MNEMGRYLKAQADLTAKESTRALTAMRLATVTVVSEDANGMMADIAWDDADGGTETPGCRCLVPYIPIVGDIVRVLTIQGGGPLILGTVFTDRSFPIVATDFNDLAGTTDFTSGSYTSFTGISCTVDKRSAHTSILVRVLGTAFATTPATSSYSFGALINGTDYLLGGNFYNTISDHRSFVAENKVATGVAAGSYTVQFRIKRDTGTGSMRFDLSDFVTIAAQEVI